MQDGPIMQAALQAALSEQPSQPASTQVKKDDPARIPRWLALLGSGAFDGLSTRAALKSNPNAYEANPIARAASGNTAAMLGLSMGGNALVGLLADLLAKKGKTGLANGLGFGVAGAKTAIGASNLSKRK